MLVVSRAEEEKDFALRVWLLTGIKNVLEVSFTPDTSF